MKLLPIVLALALAAPALAKDVCALDDDGRHYRFENPKLPKKEGKILPVLGSIRLVPQQVDAFAWGSLHGSTMRLIGIPDVYLISLFGQTNNFAFSIRLAVERDFAGSGSGDLDGDGTFESVFPIEPIDCDESTLP